MPTTLDSLDPNVRDFVRKFPQYLEDCFGEDTDQLYDSILTAPMRMRYSKDSHSTLFDCSSRYFADHPVLDGSEKNDYSKQLELYLSLISFLKDTHLELLNKTTDEDLTEGERQDKVIMVRRAYGLLEKIKDFENRSLAYHSKSKSQLLTYGAGGSRQAIAFLGINRVYTGPWWEFVNPVYVELVSDNGGKYTGWTLGGKRYGNGTYFFDNDENEDYSSALLKFDGQWLCDKYSGPGVLHYRNEDKKEAVWGGGRELVGGSAVLYHKTGARFEGYFNKEGKKCGRGSLFYPDGGVDKGVWKDDKRHGFFTYHYPNGKMMIDTEYETVVRSRGQILFYIT